MRTILVDDNQKDLRLLEAECRKHQAVWLGGVFEDPWEALRYAGKNKVDFALLEVVMAQMNGIILAEKLREINPDIIIIFVSAHNEYILSALQNKADYYVLKPFDDRDIADAVRRAYLLSQRPEKRVFVRTFGRFDIFVEDTLVKFTNAKSKELLALCVDHMGGSVTMEEAVDKLWEGRDYDSRAKALYRKAVISAGAILKEYGIGHIFLRARGSCSIRKDSIRCDCYEYLENPEKNFLYQDEYMFEYSWAEYTNAVLSTIRSEREKTYRKD